MDTYSNAKAQILDDIRDGVVPESVRSFSELHDFVDANEYLGGLALDDLDEANRTAGALDRWLAGR